MGPWPRLADRGAWALSGQLAASQDMPGPGCPQSSVWHSSLTVGINKSLATQKCMKHWSDQKPFVMHMVVLQKILSTHPDWVIEVRIDLFSYPLVGKLVAVCFPMLPCLVCGARTVMPARCARSKWLESVGMNQTDGQFLPKKKQTQ